jgi:hypothetical protein
MKQYTKMGDAMAAKVAKATLNPDPAFLSMESPASRPPNSHDISIDQVMMATVEDQPMMLNRPRIQSGALLSRPPGMN